MGFLVLMGFCGLAAAVIGKLKGSSFAIWFLIGFALPLIGVIAALLYRFERDDPRRRCERCGNLVPITTQVCSRCGHDLDYPETILPAR